MMTADKTKSPAANPPVDMASIWAESMADSDFSFDIKAQSVSIDLVRAISECGFSQADVAHKLGWSASRVSRVLHGAPNLTLRTLHELSSALSLEFDVIYRKAGEHRAPQPWEAVVMLENAAEVCKKIENLHVAAQDNLSKSECMLETARQLNRRAWHCNKGFDTVRTLVNVKVANGN